MRQLRDREAPQVAHHFQDVLVHRIHVIEIVLHLADDAAERGDIAPEHAVLMHQTQFPFHALGAAQDAHEKLAMMRVLAECRSDQTPAAPERAQRRGADPFGLVVLLQQHECLEQRSRFAFVEIFGTRFQELTAHSEALIDRMELEIFLRRDERAQVLQKDRVELRDRSRRAVVVLHELLAREPVGPIVQSEFPGKRRLMIEEHAVFASSGQIVKADAHRLEKALVTLNEARLVHRDQVAVGKLRPVLADARGARDPQDRLKVAQSARRFP